MADTKNTQTAPAGLPDKEWFTLEEVAGRWGCGVDDLLHWGGQDLLEICAFKPIGQGRRYENLYSSEDEEAEITLEPEIQSENFREWWVAPIFSVSDMYKTPLFALGRFDLQFIEREGFSEVSEGAVGAFTLEFFHSDPELAYVRLTAIDLFITRLERDSFEREYMHSAESVLTGAVSDAVPSWVDMPPQQKRAHASARYAELGNFEAVGRELGITGKRVSQLVHEHAEGASNKREGASIGAELLNMTPPTKQGKSRS